MPLKTSNKRIAETRRHNIEHDIAHGKYDPWSDPKPYRDQVTVKDSVDKFLNSADIKDSTKRQYRSSLKTIIQVTGKDRPLSTLRGDDLEEATEGLTSSAKRNVRIATLSWIRHEGIDEGLADHLPNPPEPKAQRDALRPAEIEKIKDSCLLVPRIPAAMPPIIDILAATGLRKGELAGLDVNDVRIHGDLPQIIIREKSAKTKTSIRTVPLLPRAIEAANYIIDGRERGRLLSVSYSAIYHYFKIAADDAFPGRSVTPHWMRHTFITWLVNDLALPIPVAAKIAGHTDIQTTMRYVHVTKDTVMEAINRIQGKTGPQPPSEVALWLTMGESPYELAP